MIIKNKKKQKNLNEIKLHSLQKAKAKPQRKYEIVNSKPSKNRNSIRNDTLLVLNKNKKLNLKLNQEWNFICFNQKTETET